MQLSYILFTFSADIESSVCLSFNFDCGVGGSAPAPNPRKRIGNSERSCFDFSGQIQRNSKSQIAHTERISNSSVIQVNIFVFIFMKREINVYLLCCIYIHTCMSIRMHIRVCMCNKAFFVSFDQQLHSTTIHFVSPTPFNASDLQRTLSVGVEQSPPPCISSIAMHLPIPVHVIFFSGNCQCQ
jgi:hypothetical protein